MPLVRRNIYSLSTSEVQRLVGALNAVKSSGVYDDFVRRHRLAMDILTPPAQSGSMRNAAHRGPALLPWHRYMLLSFEHRLQDVAPGITVPYWPWEQDAARLYPKQAPLWTAAYFGGDGNPADSGFVPNGPFVNWVALIFNASTGQMVPRSRPGLVRKLGTHWASPTLPTVADVNNALTESVYDSAPWNEWQSSSPSFRNRIEGTLLRGSEPVGRPRMHDRVHTWVNGDMSTGSSPNDPVFWLHHANLDRLWARWQAAGHATDYRPVSGGPAGHNLNDLLLGLGVQGPTPASLLSIDALGYSYA